MLSDGNLSLNSVNDIVKNIGSLFKTCSKQTFGEKKKVSPNFKNKIAPWFNLECRKSRNLYHNVEECIINIKLIIIIIFLKL